MTCGIYKITNKINGKAYVGQSVHIEERWRDHISLSQKGTYCYEKPLYRAFRKYGIENFDFEILEECLPEELNEKEKFYISKYNTYLEGYNCNLGGTVTIQYDKLIEHKEKIKNIIKDLQDTTLTQREIAEKYGVCKGTIRRINTGKTYVQFDLNYPIRPHPNENKIEPNYCCDCGKKITHKANRCPKCANKARRTDKPMTREELKEMIRTLSFTEIGKK